MERGRLTVRSAADSVEGTAAAAAAERHARGMSRTVDPDQRVLELESQPPDTDLPPGGRCRSFTFLERADERWTVFLVTYPSALDDWRGYFAFRPASAGAGASPVRTADLFMEETEAEVGARARGLGRPLLTALLESAMATYQRRHGFSEDARRWFRRMLSRHSARLLPDLGKEVAEPSLSHLQSVYDSYRIDQVMHLIALMGDGEFRALVGRVLEGRPIDFGARDRLQLAMLVVQDLESHLPLPPFEVWVEDYLSNREEYRSYTFALHRGETLP